MSAPAPQWPPVSFVPVKVAAVMAGTTPWVLYQAIKKGLLRSHKPVWGGDMVINVADLEAAIKGETLPTEEESDASPE